MSDTGPGKHLHHSDNNQGRHWHPWQMNQLPPAPVKKQASVQKLTLPTAAELAAKERQHAYEEGYTAGRDAGYQDGFDAGRREGEAAGREEGRQLAMTDIQEQSRQLLDPVARLVQNINEAWQKLDQDIADDLVSLALAVGRQLAREDLDSHPEQVLDIIRKLLRSDPLIGNKPCLWLHPEDLKLVQRHMAQEIEAAGWQLKTDEQFSRGGCRLSSSSGEIDATWEQRWQTVTRQVRKPRRRSRTQNAQAKSQSKVQAKAQTTKRSPRTRATK